MTAPHLALGAEGESRAAVHLERRGYRIVARNVRAGRVELDVIAQKSRTLVFVEVKSRRAGGPQGFGGHAQAAESVDERKQARLRRGARAWLQAHPLERRRAQHVRFDVITCLRETPRGPDGPDSGLQNDDTAPGGARWSIEHWEAAF